MRCCILVASVSAGNEYATQLQHLGWHTSFSLRYQSSRHPTPDQFSRPPRRSGVTDAKPLASIYEALAVQISRLIQRWIQRDRTRLNHRFHYMSPTFGAASLQNLAMTVFGRHVTVVADRRDRYERIVGKIIVDGVDAGLEEVAVGLAWHYAQYAREQSPGDRRAYASAKHEARRERRGAVE